MIRAAWQVEQDEGFIDQVAERGPAQMGEPVPLRKQDMGGHVDKRRAPDPLRQPAVIGESELDRAVLDLADEARATDLLNGDRDGRRGLTEPPEHARHTTPPQSDA